MIIKVGEPLVLNLGKLLHGYEVNSTIKAISLDGKLIKSFDISKPFSELSLEFSNGFYITFSIS